MISSYIRPSGLLALGPEAASRGFVPGAVVSVVVLSTGSLLVRLSDEPVLDLRAHPLAHTPIAGSRLALRQNSQNGCTMEPT